MCRPDEIDRVHLTASCVKFRCFGCNVRRYCTSTDYLFYELLDAELNYCSTSYNDFISQMPVIYAEGENPLTNE